MKEVVKYFNSMNNAINEKNYSMALNSYTNLVQRAEQYEVSALRNLTTMAELNGVRSLKVQAFTIMNELYKYINKC